VSVLHSSGVRRGETQLQEGRGVGKARTVSWLRIDDAFAEHPKIEALADRSFRLHVAALCYCARNLTDGHLSVKAVKVLAIIINATRITRNVDELVAAGLWIDNGDGTYSINSYLEFNPTSDEVKQKRGEISEKRREAGKRGAKARWQNVANDVANVVAMPMPPSPPVPTPISNSITDEWEETQSKFFAWAVEIDLHHSQVCRALTLGHAGMELAMLKVRSRQDVDNQAAYFDSTVKEMIASQRTGGWAKSEMSLEQRLAIYVQNAGWELTDRELREDLLENGADEPVIARLLVKADEIRQEAA
jgi:hypothetical protein